jgi:hypothetical protein
MCKGLQQQLGPEGSQKSVPAKMKDAVENFEKSSLRNFEVRMLEQKIGTPMPRNELTKAAG